MSEEKKVVNVPSNSEKESALVEVESRSTIDEIENVFNGNKPTEEVLKEVDELVLKYDLQEYQELLSRGALLANDPDVLLTDNYSEKERKRSAGS